MMQRFRRWFSDPLFLLCLAVGLGAFVVQSGELGTSDTLHRLKTSHSWWTGEPAVSPEEFPEFGIHGRNGKFHSWYGIGQSLMMLPADIVGTYAARLRMFQRYGETDPTVRDIVVSYTTNIFVNACTALICFRLLMLLGFSAAESVAGVLALLFATTHLHYTQNMMENNYILLLTLIGFVFQYKWLRTNSRKALAIGSFALGLNLLTRVTAALDLIAAGLFLLLVLIFERAGLHAIWKRIVDHLKIAAPIYFMFFLIERTYSWYSFRILFQKLCARLCRGIPPARPHSPTELPLGNAVPRGILRSPLRSRKIHLPVRPLASASDHSQCSALEAPRPAGASLHDHHHVAAACLHQLLRALQCGAAISPGETATFPPQSSSQCLFPCRYCCITGVT